MIHFERTTDYRLVREIMTHPKVYPWIADDGSPAVEEFQPVEHPAFWYVLAFEEEELLGLWLFSPQNSICWEVHTCLLPGHGFRRAREAAAAMALWIWENTPCRRIVTNVPRFNRTARTFAEAAGMTRCGVNLRSYMKNGELHDQLMLGMSRPEEPCPQP